MMMATTPRRPRQMRTERTDKKNLDIEAIVEVAREEELSEDIGLKEPELPSISLPGSISKPVGGEDISIGKSTLGKEQEKRDMFLLGEKRRSYIADVKDAIKKSMQKARERSRRRTEKDSVETVRGDQHKRSSLADAATIGLFTPLQLVY